MYPALFPFGIGGLEDPQLPVTISFQQQAQCSLRLADRSFRYVSFIRVCRPKHHGMDIGFNSSEGTGTCATTDLYSVDTIVAVLCNSSPPEYKSFLTLPWRLIGMPLSPSFMFRARTAFITSLLLSRSASVLAVGVFNPDEYAINTITCPAIDRDLNQSLNITIGEYHTVYMPSRKVVSLMA